ncbi:hypothetical protein [Azospira restricta]|uniref:Uncharacterized protein n=1 Tax=Azospira restricta TaxID=404405 RepID=A0A974SNT3_9RHOO|nr:hypothetical protein [Azospira restricta]QRJ63686.1 hypothetical protein IWH25_18420 [Azospira restricta]
MPAEIVFAGILLVFLVLLLRADRDIGRNDHQRLREMEKLCGPLPNSMSRPERLRLASLYGISSGDGRRTLLIVIAVTGLALLFLLR